MLGNIDRVLAVSSITAKEYKKNIAIEASRSGSPGMSLVCDRLRDKITLAHVGQLSQIGGAATLAER